MLKRVEIVNTKSIKTKTGNTCYLVQILCIDENLNSCIHTQFCDKTKFDTYRALLDEATERGETVSIETEVQVSIRDGRLTLSFDI